MSFTNLPLLEQTRARVIKTLMDGIQLNMSTEESKKLLKRHVNSKTNLVIMFVDISNSTEMSLSLPGQICSNSANLCPRIKYSHIRLWWLCIQV